MSLIQLFICFLIIWLVSLLISLFIELKIQKNRKSKEISERFYRMVENDKRHKMFARVQRETRDM